MKTKICTAEQGTQEWKEDKIGYQGGSNAYKIMTNGKKAGELSAGAKTYALELATDSFFGSVREIRQTFVMQRGIDLEPVAREAFIEEMASRGDFIQVEELGFIKCLEYQFGCSLDGKTDDNGIIEIKARGKDAFTDRILNGIPKKDMYQMQWNMIISDTAHCYYVCYTDELSQGLLIEKVKADKELQEKMLEKAIKVDELRQELEIKIGKKYLELTGE